MQNEREKKKKRNTLAREILNLSRDSLLVNLRFLDLSLSRFELFPLKQEFPESCLGTDGRFLCYHPLSVLRCYREKPEVLTRNYLHMVFHCVFHHPFVAPQIDQDCWDLACDIAVENAINELNVKTMFCRRQQMQSVVIASLNTELNHLSAEKIYRYYKNLRLPPVQMQSLRDLFRGDDHFLWYLSPLERAALGLGALDRENEKQFWETAAQRMQVDLETFSRNRGNTAGSLTQNLKTVTREKFDYSDFLWHFSTLGEAMKINDDEFDYIFYTYGMEHYDRMPLIEPLEYKEVRRIKEFVIAIDTSGSVSGEQIQKFVQKTYNILKQQESFFTKINLHIIQCDAEIQEDVKITSQEEFDGYLERMQLHGFGGTDFRPVFSYVDQLITKKEFINLKGMIYFTDGFGVFPENMPPYHTAFVFVNDDYETPPVPVWAIKLILQSDEI